MLAYDEKNKLSEFEDDYSLGICESCHRIYRRTVNEQSPGFREREYDVCPYCENNNGSSMSHEYFNSILSEAEIGKLRKKSLFKQIRKYCHQQYMQTQCVVCDHHSGCPGKSKSNCKQCLNEVHYPDSYPYGRKDYDCDRMIYFYVCDYISKYTSEILYLMRKSESLQKIDEYHVLSIGCGASPDLMALEFYCHEKSYNKTVRYCGIDVNKRWKSIHDQINTYRTRTIKDTEFIYKDVVNDDFSIEGINVVILQYVISHFYNTRQISKIQGFFTKLVEEIIKRKQDSMPLVVLINDVNSVYRGRDYFLELVQKLEDANLCSNYKKFYFDYKIKCDAQRYGEKHESRKIIFSLPESFKGIYEPWEDCSSAQLLIEVQ